MKKLRLILSIFLAGTFFAACGSSLTAPDDCMQASDCGWPTGDG